VPVRIERARVAPSGFEKVEDLPYGLQIRDFRNTLDALYDYFEAVNVALMARGLEWVEHTVRPAAVSNMISDLAAAALAKYSNGLVENRQHNGHPDLIPRGMYPGDAIHAGGEGVEIKSTKGRVADTHGARAGWVCQFNYRVDDEPVIARRRPTIISHVYLARVTTDLFRRNVRRSELGTNTSTLDANGLRVLRAGLIYKDPSVS
jgi:hypothetical protein